jgi:hypothetical protein
MTIRALLAAGGCVAAASAGIASENVYRNGPEDIHATNFFQPGQFDPVSGFYEEVGDVVTLTGTGRTITEMTVYYATDVDVPTGSESIHIRFYSLDGPPVGNPPRPSPGTLIWDSGSIPVLFGWRAQRILVPNVVVPDSFAWSASFEGTTGDPGDRIGLRYMGAPTTGSSDTSVWTRDDPALPWNFMVFDYSDGTTPYGSFGATFWADGGPTDVFYDNTVGTGRTDTVMNTTEFGDDAVFEGDDRHAGAFTFEYVSDILTATGGESATVRFYSRDETLYGGPPSTLLYESAPMTVARGPGAHSLSVFPDVDLPDYVIWTVAWGGLQQVPGDSASLIAKTGPIPGASSESFWTKTEAGMSQYWFGNPTFDPTTYPETDWGFNFLVANLSAKFQTTSFATPVEHGVNTVLKGLFSGGWHADMDQSDNRYWSISPGLVASLTEDPVRIVVEHALPGSSPSGLNLTVESRRLGPPVYQILEVWNYTTARWDLLDQGDLPAGADPDRTVTLSIPSLPDHIGPGNNVKIRIRCNTPRFHGVTLWSALFDREYLDYVP